MTYTQVPDMVDFGPASVLYADEMPYESNVTCLVTCVTDCCVPVAAFCCCPCKLCSMTYKLKDETWRPTKYVLCHKLQSWLLRHPFAEQNLFCCLRPLVSIHDVAGYGTTMIKEFRSTIGEWWCDNMKVEMAHPETMKLMMTSPQDGGPALGQAWLRPEKLPRSPDGHNLFLLALPNGLGGEWAEGSARHAHLRQMIFKYLITEGTTKRQSTSDPVTRRLFANLRPVVLSGESSSVWTKSQDGLAGFMLRYMHYALFGLDLSDEQFDDLWSLYYSPSPALSDASFIVILMRYVGNLFEATGSPTMAALPERRAKAIAIYKASPALQGYSDAAEPVRLDDFLNAFVTVLGLAGLQGPLGAASHLLANYKGYIPECKRYEPPTQYAWGYGDRAKMRLQVLETMRMQPAVFGSGLTMPKPLKCPQLAKLAVAGGGSGGGEPVVFPKGTAVHINFVASNFDTAVWGEDAGKFEPEAHAKLLEGYPGCPYPNFNSWGGVDGDGVDDAVDARSGGRECPGKEMSITMHIDLIELVLQPEKKPAAASPPPSPPPLSMERP